MITQVETVGALPKGGGLLLLLLLLCISLCILLLLLLSSLVWLLLLFLITIFLSLLGRRKGKTANPHTKNPHSSPRKSILLVASYVCCCCSWLDSTCSVFREPFLLIAVQTLGVRVGRELSYLPYSTPLWNRVGAVFGCVCRLRRETYIFHRIGWKGKIWQLCKGKRPLYQSLELACGLTRALAPRWPEGALLLAELPVHGVGAPGLLCMYTRVIHVRVCVYVYVYV